MEESRKLRERKHLCYYIFKRKCFHVGDTSFSQEIIGQSESHRDKSQLKVAREREDFHIALKLVLSYFKVKETSLLV